MTKLLRYTRVPRHQPSDLIKAVLLLLHGVGADEQAMLPLVAGADPRMEALSLQAPILMGPSSYAWFAVRFTDKGPEMNLHEAEQSRVALLAFIRHYRAQHPERAVYLMGFSQGATMSLVTALTAPEDVQGAVCFSGRFPEEYRDYIVSTERLQHTHIWVGHGLNDTILPISYGRATRDLLALTRTPHAYEAFVGGHEVPEAGKQAAHAWLNRLADTHVFLAVLQTIPAIPQT